MNRILLSTLVFLICVTHLMAAERETVHLNEVVITATRYEEKISSIPANVSVITEEEIKNSTARNIPDLLRMDTGIHVNDIAANGRNVTVDLRGFGATAVSNTLVLVDGRRVNQADLSGVDWSQIPLDRVKKIEVIRGGQGSVLYGDNASAGVINIITKAGDARKFGAGAAAGSYETYKGNAYFSNRTDKVAYSLTGSYVTSDGYRENSDTEAKDIGFTMNAFLGDTVNLHFSGGYHKDNTGLPGALKESDFSAGASRTETVNPEDFAEVEDYYFKGGPEFYFLDDSFIKLDVSYRKRSGLTFSSFVGGSFLGDTDIKTTSVSPQLVLKHEAGPAMNSLTLGYDYGNAKEEIINDSSFSGTARFDLEKENYGYYIHDELRIIEKLVFSGGYRHDKVDFTFTPGTPDTTGLDEDLYTAGVNFTYYRNSYAYVSYARSFRYPVLDELFNFITNSVDTGLLPQKSDNYEIGLRHYFSDALYAHVNLFRIDTIDEILYNPAGGAFGFGANENLDGKTRRDGVEVAMSARLVEWLSIDGNYSYMDASIVDGQYEGSDIPNVPEHKATLGISASPVKGLSLALNGVYIGERPFDGDFTNSFDGQESYIVLNSKIKYQWNYLTAFLDINNLTDEKYSEFGALSLFSFPVETAVYPSPGINVLFGVSVDI